LKKIILSILLAVILVFVGWTIINNKPADRVSMAGNSDKKEAPDVETPDSTSSETKQHEQKKPTRDDKKGCVVHL
jgi:hypothetical protein